MNVVAETAVVALALLGLVALAAIGALVYVVRRVTPWPKPPVPAQPRKQPETAQEVAR